MFECGEGHCWGIAVKFTGWTGGDGGDFSPLGKRRAERKVLVAKNKVGVVGGGGGGGWK
jgi:hypothetical protein